MKRGYLSDYFEGVASKRLSSVEVHPERSHQHEFNGVTDLKRILGPAKIENIKARFVFLSDSEEGALISDSSLTWYDSREEHPTRSEFRLYFTGNSAVDAASEGDLLVIGKRKNSDILVLIAKANSTAQNQLIWLFGLEETDGQKLKVKEIERKNDPRLVYASRIILQEIGIDAIEGRDSFLDQILGRFGAAFPSTKEFSAFARGTLPDISAQDNPDDTLIAWMEREEELFRTLERHLVSSRLSTGFDDDVDSFIDFSLSVHNRRKSRAGKALENHLEQIFKDIALRYSRGEITENNSRPDFIFPGIKQYRDPKFPAGRLSLLGAKTTCKDRWRQVLVEAERIKEKHLLTLEPGISEDQTAEMGRCMLQLVAPLPIHMTFSKKQQKWLMSLKGFIGLAQKRQRVR